MKAQNSCFLGGPLGNEIWWKLWNIVVLFFLFLVLRWLLDRVACGDLRSY
jgi:hypothetical protein